MITGPVLSACFACRLSVASAGVVSRDMCRGCDLIVKEKPPQRVTVRVFDGLRERNIAQACCCVVCVCDGLRERKTTPARQKSGKISGFRRAGAINISCRQAQSRAGATFLAQHPNRHATWWKCAPCECQRELSVGTTDDRHEADECRERNTPLAVHHKSPCFDHLRSRREKIRPAAVGSD